MGSRNVVDSIATNRVGRQTFRRRTGLESIENHIKMQFNTSEQFRCPYSCTCSNCISRLLPSVTAGLNNIRYLTHPPSSASEETLEGYAPYVQANTGA